jgi:hypothetical protein
MGYASSTSKSYKENLEPPLMPKSLFERINPECAGKKLTELNADEVASWLLSALHEHLVEGLGVRGYREAVNFIVRGESLSHGLSSFVETLDERYIMIFRSACGRVINRLDFNQPEHQRQAVIVLDFSAAINSSQALSALAKKTADLKPDRWSENLYRSALEYVRLQIKWTPNAGVEILRHLIHVTDRFPATEAGLTLVSLSAADPNHFLDHWQLLALALDSHYKIDLPDDQESLAGRRMRLADALLNKCLASVPNRYLLLGAEAEKQSENVLPLWWLDAVFRSEDAELKRVIREITPLWTGLGANQEVPTRTPSISVVKPERSPNKTQHDANNDNIQTLAQQSLV